MCPFSSEDSARTSVRALQIIVAALALGVLAFTGVAITIVLGNRAAQQQQPDLMTAYLAIGFAATALGLRFVIGGLIAAGHRKKLAAGHRDSLAGTDLGDQLLLTFQQKTIFERALMEGALFFVLISFIIAGQWWSLGVAAVLLIALVIPFPTYDAVADWVRQQRELIELERR